MTRGSLRTARRRHDGVAAVETGLVMMLLSPLLIGVLFYGNYFWQAQKMSAYAPQVNQSQVMGVYNSCADLLTAVKGTVLTNVNNVSTATPIQLDDITATVVDFLPDQLGVDVRISVRVPVVNSVISNILPNNGDVVSEALTRLENVRLNLQTC